MIEINLTVSSDSPAKLEEIRAHIMGSCWRMHWKYIYGLGRRELRSGRLRWEVDAIVKQECWPRMFEAWQMAWPKGEDRPDALGLYHGKAHIDSGKCRVIKPIRAVEP